MGPVRRMSFLFDQVGVNAQQALIWEEPSIDDPVLNVGTALDAKNPELDSAVTISDENIRSSLWSPSNSFRCGRLSVFLQLVTLAFQR